MVKNRGPVRNIVLHRQIRRRVGVRSSALNPARLVKHDRGPRVHCLHGLDRRRIRVVGQVGGHASRHVHGQIALEARRRQHHQGVGVAIDRGERTLGSVDDRDVSCVKAGHRAAELEGIENAAAGDGGRASLVVGDRDARFDGVNQHCVEAGRAAVAGGVGVAAINDGDRAKSGERTKRGEGGRVTGARAGDGAEGAAHQKDVVVAEVGGGLTEGEGHRRGVVDGH